MTTKITTADSGVLPVSRRRFMQAGAALVTLPFMTTGAGAAAMTACRRCRPVMPVRMLSRPAAPLTAAENAISVLM